MRIERGPRKRKKDAWGEDSHAEVAELNLSAQIVPPWHERTFFEDLNITVKGQKRKSTIDIYFERNDVLVLHNAMTKGLIARSNKLGKVAEALRKIRDVAAASRMAGESRSLDTIRRMADSALQRLHS